jgi:YVTN family beta-propeller protein
LLRSIRFLEEKQHMINAAPMITSNCRRLRLLAPALAALAMATIFAGAAAARPQTQPAAPPQAQPAPAPPQGQPGPTPPQGQPGPFPGRPAPPPLPVSGYHIIRKIPIAGTGGWDYLNEDSDTGRLFISRGTHIQALDLALGLVTGDIPDTQGVHGVALAPEFGRGFTSNGGTASVTIFDLKTLAKIGEAKTDPGTDAIIYDPASKRVFTMNGRSGTATAIDAATGAVAGSIALGGRPEFPAADAAGHVYVNLEDKSEVVELDSQKLTVLNTWPAAPCESPSGMAIDREHRRLIIGCHNKLMAIMDADSGKVVTTVPIGSGVDANRFDPGTQLAFSSNGDGTLTIVHEDTPDSFKLLDNIATQQGARTMEVDLATHHVFLVTASYGPAPAPTADMPRPRPQILPDSMVVIELSQ